MILAGVENISGCTKYTTIRSLKVSAITSALSQLTVGGENGLRARLQGSGPCPQPLWGSERTAFRL